MIKDLAEARRCVQACADYLRTKGDSPAAADLLTAVKIIRQDGREELRQFIDPIARGRVQGISYVDAQDLGNRALYLLRQTAE